MKNIVLSLLTVGILFVTGNAFAQISVGPKAGLNISRFAGDDEADLDGIKSKIGFQVGGMLNAQLNDYFAIRPELVFSNIGSKFKFDDYKLNISTNYLSLPVNFVGQIPVSDNFNLQFFAGPYAALGLGGKAKGEYSDRGQTEKVSQPIKMKKNPGEIDDDNLYLNGVDFGLNFGLGFQASGFVFTANYALGLTNLESHYKNAAAEDKRGADGKVYNRNVTIGVAYLFGGK